MGIDIINDGPDCLFDLCKKNLEPVKDHVNFIRMESAKAAALYEDESLDFVFIDACHETEAVKADILAWWPKVKIGGILAGHDYFWTQVQPAVDELLPGVQVWRNSWVIRRG
jgi:predicted O-methyltransferase YrrM